MAEKLLLTEAELTNCARMVQYAGLAQGAMHALLAEVESFREGRARLAEMDKALHDLTPGGSEFARNPKRCAAWIRKELDKSFAALRKAVVLRRQLAEAQQENSAIVDAVIQVQDQLDQTKLQLAEAQATIAAWRQLVDAVHMVFYHDHSSCPGCDDSEFPCEPFRQAWDSLRPLSEAALASDAGKNFLEQYQKMEAALRHARGWIMEVLVAENEASPENTHMIRMIDDALDKPKAAEGRGA